MTERLSVFRWSFARDVLDLDASTVGARQLPTRDGVAVELPPNQRVNRLTCSCKNNRHLRELSVTLSADP